MQKFRLIGEDFPRTLTTPGCRLTGTKRLEPQPRRMIASRDPTRQHYENGSLSTRASQRMPGNLWLSSHYLAASRPAVVDFRCAHRQYQ
jgi:hypothetical protein